MKKVIALILTMALLLALAGCSESDLKETPSESQKGDSSTESNNSESSTNNVGSNSGDTFKIYMIGGMPGGPAWGPASTGFALACSELGWDGSYLAPTQPANQTEIYDLITTAATNGADAIIALAYDADILSDLVDDVMGQGIIMIGANAGLETLDAVVGVDTESQASMFAEAVLAAVPEGEHIYSVSMVTTLNTTTDAWNSIYQGIILEARGAENCTFYDTMECQSSTQTAYDNFAAFKLAHPECNVFVSQNSYAGLGVASWIEENGAKDSLYAFGIDDSEEILQAVKDGNLTGTLSQGFYNIGYKGVYTVQTILNGEEHEWHISSDPTIVWPETVDEWAAKLGYTLQ